MDKNMAKKVALGAVLAAMVTVATMLHIPMPGMRIYFNLGEGVLYVVALLLGSHFAGLCGGLGAALRRTVAPRGSSLVRRTTGARACRRCRATPPARCTSRRCARVFSKSPADALSGRRS